MSPDPMADFDAEVRAFLLDAGVEQEQIRLQIPPQREQGERSFAAMPLAKAWRQAPFQIAQQIAARFEPGKYGPLISSIEAVAPGFVNFRVKYGSFLALVVETIERAGDGWGRPSNTTRVRVVVEHTSVNPNKEWHIGHVRNAVLGDVVGRILRVAGNAVQIQNYIDDTGVQAAQAVLGTRDFPEELKPGEKYDHYAGRLYAKVAGELGAEQLLKARLEASEDWAERTSLEARLDNLKNLQASILQIMHALESGEYESLTHRILRAQLQTAYRLGIYYDLLNWESNLVESHLFDQAMNLLQHVGAAFRPSDGRYAGALVIRTTDTLTESGEPKAEVLIRSNGLPTYVGKDIAYHLWKFGLLPGRLRCVPFETQPNGEVLWSTSLHGEERDNADPQRVVNVIAVDQSQAQQTVREALRAAGFPEAADNYFHLAYGLVTTAEGRLSGRKGTAFSGDDLIDEAVRVAHERIKEKRSQDLTDSEMEEIAEAVGIGAVRYFMIQYNPLRDIVFNVADVVSYDGNTALYVQYAVVRMQAILRRAREEHGISDDAIDRGDTGLLTHEQEKRLAYHLAQYPGLISDTARTLAVNLVAEYAFDLATIFNQFYRDCGVLNAEPNLREARLRLVRSVRSALQHACGLLGVPVIERL